MVEHKGGKLSLKAIEAFIAVVEEGSVSRGANRLGISISATSLQLSNLEAALAVRLIERSAQRFSLTEAGLLFRERAMRIMDELDGAKADLTNRKGSPHFVLRMAIVEDFDNHILPRWLGILSEAFPNAHFAVKSGPSHENFSILSSRATDLIVAVDAMDSVDWIEEHPLMQDPYILVTAPEIGNEPSLDTLQKYPFIRYAREQHMGRQIEAQLRRVKFTPPKSHEFSSNQALFSMVAATKGWTISTAAAVHGTFAHRAEAFRSLKFSALPIPAFSRNVSLYARKDILRQVPEMAALSLRDSLKEIFSEANNSLHLPRLPIFHQDHHE